MPKLLTPEEYESEFGGGFRAEAPRAGLGTRFGASIDRAQAGLLGIGEAAGLPLGDMRRANQFESQESRGRFFRDNPDEPESFRDVDGVGSAGRFVRGLAIDSAPELTTSLATGGAGALMGLGTAGRVGLAAAANYPAAVGDILQNQRDEGGRTRLGVATALGVPYAAADLVGLDAALAGGRMARTGIRRLDDMQGFRGGLARTGANVALNAPIEGASETFQEGINQLGRISVNPNQTLFNEDANQRYLESFVGGAALGGSASAALGGWRRSARAQPRTVDEGQFDLTGNGNPPQFNLTTEMDPLQGRINQNLGLQRTPLRGYEQQFLEAFNEPSGRFVSDPQTGVERELTAGELQQMELGELQAQQEATTQREQQIAQETLLETSRALGVTPVATMDNTYDVLGARVYGQPQVAKLVQEVAVLNSQLPPEQQQLNAAILGANMVSFSGRTSIPTAQRIGNAINGKIKQLQLEGVESIERAAEILNDQVATLVAAGKNEGDVKLGQIATVYERLTGQTPPALGGTTAAAPAVTAPAAQTQQPQFQRAPAPQGQTNVSRAATPAAPAAPSVDGRSPVVPGSVGNTGRDAAVDQGVGGDVGVAGPATQQAAPVSSADVQQPAAVAEDANPLDALLTRHFDGNARKSEIAKAYLSALKLAPKGSSGAVVQTIATKFGIKPVTVRSYGNTTELRGTAATMGFTPEQIEALDLPDNTKAAPKAKVKLEPKVRDGNVVELPYMGPGRNADANAPKDPAKTQAMAAAGFETAEDVQSSGFGGMDESNTWKQGREGMGDTENSKDEAKANEIASLLDQQDALRDLIEEYEQNGQTDLIEGVQTQIETLQSKLDASLKALETYLQGKAKKVSTKVGKELEKEQKPAKGKKAKAAPVVDEDTAPTAERAADAWNEVADSMGSAFPQFQDLSTDDQKTFTEFGSENWTRQDVIKFAQDTGGDFVGAQFGKDIKEAKAKNPYTAKELLAELKDFIRADIPGRKLLVVDSIEDLLRSPDKMVRAVGAGIALENAYGVAANGRGYLIANRIQKGAGRAKFMHEVGAHLGLEKLLPKAEYDKLTQQIVNWAKKDDGSIESELALNAAERVQNAGTKQEDRRLELLAYFIEEAMEAGIDPTADVKSSGPLRDWFRSLWAAFKTAARKLGMKPESMTAQDVVNLAFGAARLEINGTWHGTAASFRNFRNKFIGSGEGATAYGWGTYLAQRTGIAKGYFRADVERKTKQRRLKRDAETLDRGNKWAEEELGMDQAASSVNELRRRVNITGQELPDWAFTSSKPEGNLMRVDTAVEDDRVFDYDKIVIKQPEYVVNKLLELLDPVADEILDRTNKDVEELTGRDLIGTGENDLGLLSNLIMDDVMSLSLGQDKQFDEAVRQGKFHEAASHMLRGIGLDGIKFFDAKSRGTATDAISFGGRNYNRDDLRDQVRKYRGTDSDKSMQFLLLKDVLRNGIADVKAGLEAKVAKQAEMFAGVYADSAARFKVKADVAADRARAQKEADESYEGQQLAWLNANEADISFVQNPKTRNLIVFDDKNVFRVGGEAAADPQRMKFGSDMVELGKRGQLKEKAGKTRVDTANDRAIKLLDKAAKAKDPAEAEALRAEAYALFGATAGKLTGMKFGKNASSVPSSVKPQVNLITRTLRTGADAALNKIIFSEDLFKRAAKMGLSAARDMDRIYRERSALTGNIEREVTRIENMYNRIPESAKGTGAKSANQFLYDSTRENKWGFTPTWRGKDASKVKVDPAIAQRYNALPKEARAWVSAVLEHGDKMLKTKKDTLIASTNSEYDALIADARQRGETNKVTRLEKDKAASLKQFQRLFATNEFNPYAPMRRFGDFVVIGKSKAYLDATPTERTKMESDPDQYHVSFAESRSSALELERQLTEQGSFSEVSTRAKEDARGDMYGGLMDAFNKLRGNIESELGNATEPKEIAALRAARETVAELYLQSLAENSARKSEMRRRGVAGEIDMLRSFSTQGRADAHFLASAKYNPQTQEAVVKMRQQAKQGGSQLEKSEAFKEIMARHTQSMRYEEGGWFDVAANTSRITSIWMLATNPMYYLQNLTQPFVLSLPFMTGKHNWTDASGQLMRAYFQLGDLLKSAKVGEGFDFTKVSKDKGEQDMVLKLVDRGRIDIGMDTELGQVKLEGDNIASKAATRGDQILRSLSQKVEAVNRVSTALAAYRLEIKAGRTPAQALEYADEVISQTHGDYTRINAPRLFNTPGGKVALQFRKFQLIQLTLLTKLVYNSFANSNKAEKAAARKILTYTLAHTGVLAGVVGMPGFAAAAFIINKLADLFGDDDEPYNLENELRKMLGGGDVARLVMRGAPTLAGADLSGKLGMGNALSILPYTDFDATREGFNAIATGLTLGATGGLGARVFQGLGDIINGDYYRGLMGLAPIGVSQAIKAGVEAYQGETNRRGDVLVSADEINTFETFAKAVGWPTSAVAERRFDRGVAFDNKEAFEGKSAKLKNEYTKAVRGNDSEARRAAIEKWQRLQKSRQEAGFKPQPLSILMKAPQEQAKRERNTAGGVQFNNQNRQFVQEQTAN